jgi:hypothetical protein
MKMIGIWLIILLSTVKAQAAESYYFQWEPELQAGVGLMFPSPKTEPLVRPNLVAKEYLFTMAEDKFTSLLLGAKILGLGAQVDTSGSLGVVVSPACIYLLASCLGPDLIFTKLNQVNFGLSWTLRFY